MEIEIKQQQQEYTWFKKNDRTKWVEAQNLEEARMDLISTLAKC